MSSCLVGNRSQNQCNQLQTSAPFFSTCVFTFLSIKRWLISRIPSNPRSYVVSLIGNGLWQIEARAKSNSESISEDWLETFTNSATSLAFSSPNLEIASKKASAVTFCWSKLCSTRKRITSLLLLNLIFVISHIVIKWLSVKMPYQSGSFDHCQHTFAKLLRYG